VLQAYVTLLRDPSDSDDAFTALLSVAHAEAVALFVAARAANREAANEKPSSFDDNILAAGRAERGRERDRSSERGLKGRCFEREREREREREQTRFLVGVCEGWQAGSEGFAWTLPTSFLKMTIKIMC